MGVSEGANGRTLCDGGGKCGWVFSRLLLARLGQRSELAGHAAAVSQAANASKAKPSGRFLDGVMIQEAAEGRLAPDFRIERRLCWVIKAERNDVIDSLVRAAGVVIFLDDGERAAQVGFTHQNQIIKRLTYFPHVTLRKRIAPRRMRRRFENA